METKKEVSLKELIETMKKMESKGYDPYLKGGKNRVRPIYK